MNFIELHAPGNLLADSRGAPVLQRFAKKTQNFKKIIILKKRFKK